MYKSFFIHGSLFLVHFLKFCFLNLNKFLFIIDLFLNVNFSKFIITDIDHEFDFCFASISIIILLKSGFVLIF